MDVIFLGILFYLLYRFVTGFLIPVFRTSRQVREQFSRMKEQPGAGHKSERSSAPGNDSAQNARAHRRPDTAKVGEYIDFEEVKE